MKCPLIQAWKNFHPKKPCILPGDEGVLKYYDQRTDWDGYIADPEFGAPDDSPLHLDLLPMPFIGNLKTASVFLLLLNPGLGPSDYFGEYKVPEYREALLGNLRQPKHNSFLFLDPRFSWHGGYRYWHKKLHNAIVAFAKKQELNYGDARKVFQSHIAAIELVPYHSRKFAVPGRVFNNLRSVQLAQAFVRDELLSRAKSGDCLVIVTRAAKQWPLAPCSNVVVYSNAEARSAHLTADSRGGAAILEFLGRVSKRRRRQKTLA